MRATHTTFSLEWRIDFFCKCAIENIKRADLSKLFNHSLFVVVEVFVYLSHSNVIKHFQDVMVWLITSKVCLKYVNIMKRWMNKSDRIFSRQISFRRLKFLWWCFDWISALAFPFFQLNWLFKKFMENTQNLDYILNMYTDNFCCCCFFQSFVECDGNSLYSLNIHFWCAAFGNRINFNSVLQLVQHFSVCCFCRGVVIIIWDVFIRNRITNLK